MNPSHRHLLVLQDDDDTTSSIYKETILQDGPWKGATIITERTTTSDKVRSLSTHSCRDSERFEDEMPSLDDDYTASLFILDLDQSRYIQQISSSLQCCNNLQALYLTNCCRLQTLPSFIGDCLKHLKVLDLTDSNSITHLPESIGQLEKYVLLVVLN